MYPSLVQSSFATALICLISYLSTIRLSFSGDRRRTHLLTSEQFGENIQQNVTRFRHRFFGPPGDVHIGTHENAAILVHLALAIPVRIDVERVAASRPDGDDIERDAIFFGHRRRSGLPAIAADSGQKRKAALAGEIERRLSHAMMLDPDMRNMRARPGGGLII